MVNLEMEKQKGALRSRQQVHWARTLGEKIHRLASESAAAAAAATAAAADRSLHNT